MRVLEETTFALPTTLTPTTARKQRKGISTGIFNWIGQHIPLLSAPKQHQKFDTTGYTAGQIRGALSLRKTFDRPGAGKSSTAN
jgi:hypothetical protein